MAKFAAKIQKVCAYVVNQILRRLYSDMKLECMCKLAPANLLTQYRVVVHLMLVWQSFPFCDKNYGQKFRLVSTLRGFSQTTYRNIHLLRNFRKGVRVKNWHGAGYWASAPPTTRRVSSRVGRQIPPLS